MGRNERLNEAISNFSRKFKYFPRYPRNIDFDQIEFAKELEKCVADNFDYTIEKYGTIPSKNLGMPDIIYD